MLPEECSPPSSQFLKRPVACAGTPRAPPSSAGGRPTGRLSKAEENDAFFSEERVVEPLLSLIIRQADPAAAAEPEAAASAAMGGGKSRKTVTALDLLVYAVGALKNVSNNTVMMKNLGHRCRMRPRRQQPSSLNLRPAGLRCSGSGLARQLIKSLSVLCCCGRRENCTDGTGKPEGSQPARGLRCPVQCDAVHRRGGGGGKRAIGRRVEASGGLGGEQHCAVERPTGASVGAGDGDAAEHGGGEQLQLLVLQLASPYTRQLCGECALFSAIGVRRGRTTATGSSSSLST